MSFLFKLQVGSYFYDRNSVTCTSEFRDPKQSRESTERALQHSVEFRSLPKAQRTVRWEILECQEIDLSHRLASGNYAACGFQIFLQRKHQPLIYQVKISAKNRNKLRLIFSFQIYIPCCLFVSVSWISFVIDPKVGGGHFPWDKEGTTATCFSLRP